MCEEITDTGIDEDDNEHDGLSLKSPIAREIIPATMRIMTRTSLN
jgi:hypothetical protein